MKKITLVLLLIILLVSISLFFISNKTQTKEIIHKQNFKADIDRSNTPKLDKIREKRDAEFKEFKEKQNAEFKEIYKDSDKFIFGKLNEKKFKKALSKTSYCLDMVTIDEEVTFIPIDNGKYCFTEDEIEYYSGGFQ